MDSSGWAKQLSPLRHYVYLPNRPDLVAEYLNLQKEAVADLTGALISLAVVLISLLASRPDGLERVAIDMGFINAGHPPRIRSSLITDCLSR
jgi:hypothetical protein